MSVLDWPDYLQVMQSERSVYMGGPFDMSQAWGMFCQDAGQWALFGHGALMFENKDTGTTLGQVGINHGPLFPEKELGWLTYPDAEGLGYAFEAAAAMRDYASNTLKLPTLVSYIDPDNTRSQKLAHRLGAVLDPTAQRPAQSDLVFRHF